MSGKLSPPPHPGKVVAASSISGAIIGLVATNLLYPQTASRHFDFIKVKTGDDDTLYVNTKNIRWTTHDCDNKCFYICTDPTGCRVSTKPSWSKYTLCEKDSPASYKFILEHMPPDIDN